MPEPEENEEGQEEEEDEGGDGPISGLLPKPGDMLGIINRCKCVGGMEWDACCPPQTVPGPGKEGAPPPRPASGDEMGICQLLIGQIQLQINMHMGFCLAFEPILDIPPKPPAIPLPDMPTLGLDLSLPIPAIPLPGLEPLAFPGLDLPGFIPPVPSLDIPPFPGISLFGIMLWPINFAIGLFTLDLQIPIPSADPCDLISGFGLQCPGWELAIPMLSIVICILCLICFFLIIILPLLIILMGSQGDAGEIETVVLIEPPARYSYLKPETPPQVIIKNPQDARTDKINHFDLNRTGRFIVKRFDLKYAFEFAGEIAFPHYPIAQEDGPPDLPNDASDSIRAGDTEGDELHAYVLGLLPVEPEDEDIIYDWRVYGEVEVDLEGDVITMMQSMGFATEGPDKGKMIPITLAQRVPLASQRSNSRNFSFRFTKPGLHEVMCFATKGGSTTVKLQVIVQAGDKDFSELPDVLKEMRMPPELAHIKRSTGPEDYVREPAVMKAPPTDIPEGSVPDLDLPPSRPEPSPPAKVSMPQATKVVPDFEIDDEGI
jgi:hypothetical protein